jgi:magnesium-transporting ATPase (P-type)
LVDDDFSSFEILKTNEFDSDRKAMSIVVREASTQRILVFVKGADSSVIKMCDKSSEKEIKGI